MQRLILSAFLLALCSLASAQATADGPPAKGSDNNRRGPFAGAGAAAQEAMATERPAAASNGSYRLSIHSINLGGGVSTNGAGGINLRQTIGQGIASGQALSSAGSKTGGYRMRQGFLYTILNRRGDINLDGSVDNNDLILLLQHFSNTKPLTGNGLKAADINQDGAVTTDDLILLLQALLGAVLLDEY